MTLRVSAAALSRIQSTASTCAESVTSTRGEDEVTAVGNLPGADLSSKASTAATSVSDTRSTYAKRLTNHSEGTYDASREFYEADEQAAAGAKSS